MSKVKDSSETAKSDFPSLGARVFAAVMSYCLGLKGIDYTLRRYVELKNVHPDWERVGEMLVEHLNSRDAVDEHEEVDLMDASFNIPKDQAN